MSGTLTTKEIHQILVSRGMQEEYPLFTQINKIAFEGAEPETIADIFMHEELEPIVMFGMEVVGETMDGPSN